MGRGMLARAAVVGGDGNARSWMVRPRGAMSRLHRHRLMEAGPAND
jgi:hypothetical protein